MSVRVVWQVADGWGAVRRIWGCWGSWTIGLFGWLWWFDLMAEVGSAAVGWAGELIGAGVMGGVVVGAEGLLVQGGGNRRMVGRGVRQKNGHLDKIGYPLIFLRLSLTVEKIALWSRG